MKQIFYQKIKTIRWENYLKSDGSLAVGATLSGNRFTHSQFIALKTKDAIVDRFEIKLANVQM